MISFLHKKSKLLLLLLVAFYLVTHLVGLLELPVFADEAIYIRWSQLIIDDASRYLFFPMNDGKTPLFFWLLAPFQFLFSDQLFAARFVSVLVGLAQMLVLMKITSVFTKNFKTIYLSGFFVSVLPFWYFHHRMALTDGLLTLLLSCSILFLVSELKKQKSSSGSDLQDILNQLKSRDTVMRIFFAGVFFGLALITKVPAILFAPSFFLLTLLIEKRTFQNLFLAVCKVVIILGIGIGLFATLKFVPSFSQLFGRGSDFLLPFGEVLSGKWKETLPSLPVYVGYFAFYMTPTLFFLLLIGLFSRQNKSLVHIFFWSGVLFIFPIGLLGKVVYTRYLFPATIYFTLASVFAIEDLFVFSKQFGTKLWHTFLVSGALVLLISNSIANSGTFMVISMTNHTQLPLVQSDVVQYLTEWSSGHGLYEVSQLIKNEAKHTTLAVATEGSFGSLPDGLNLYFHRKDVSNIYIDGVGFPVGGITQSFAQRADSFEKKWLVINSHRMHLNIDKKYLLKEYCRPFNAPCLQVWDITEVFETLIIQ